MARIALSAKLRTNNRNGTPTADTVGVIGDMVGTAPYATVDANIATLVADAATPTQAHVTTLNGNWTTLKATLNPTVQDVVLSFDNAVITSRNQLRQVVMAIIEHLPGYSTLTA